jgi:multidrug efflux pump subunit AcrA (membrane-fusion protein)
MMKNLRNEQTKLSNSQTRIMTTKFTSFQKIYRNEKKSGVKKWSLLIVFILIVTLFLPWTQNIRAKGNVTALRQEQRPQQINTVIGGKVEQWYVKEGDVIKQGDTILRLSEIKADYLDPNLLQRTTDQLNAKQSGIGYYKQKVNANEAQMKALENALQAKMQQLSTKLQQLQVKAEADSMDMMAAINDWKIATLQFNRQKALYDSGLVSLTQLETRNQSFQNASAKKISAENKFIAAKQEINITRIEFSAIEQEYAEKTSKAEGDKFSSLSMIAATQADVAKLQNLFASYSVRNGMYYVTAPQDGQIVKTKTAGIGEVVKEGEMLLSIVPRNVQYAVELYVRPADLPLINIGQKVRFVFDGFPVILFSGWPQLSYGTFGGIVSAVENNVSENGNFKVLVREDSTEKKWPPFLKMGTGANGIALLKNVPIWYELWRNINSFPPDYYQTSKNKEQK